MADRGEQNFVWVNNEVYVFNENKQEKTDSSLAETEKTMAEPENACCYCCCYLTDYTLRWGDMNDKDESQPILCY